MSAALLLCTVIAVHDGDTLTARCEDRVHKVRLTEIDAPELGQPYSKRSADALRRLCLHRAARIESPGADRYGRTLGRVYCGNIDASAAQVRTGMAWAFDKYLTDPAIKTAETEARAARRGLWRSKMPVSPTDYRESHAR